MIASILQLGTALLAGTQRAGYVAAVHNTVEPTVIKGSDFAQIERIAALTARDLHKNVTITTAGNTTNVLATFGPLQKHALKSTDHGVTCLCGSRGMDISAADVHRNLATLQNG